MTQTLQHLIADASLLAGVNLCAYGHQWESDGGRACPKGESNRSYGIGAGRFSGGCSQTVYRCTRCGEYDYGDHGGPAYTECNTLCEFGHRGEL